MSASTGDTDDRHIPERMHATNRARKSRRRSRNDRPAKGVVEILESLLAEKVTRADGARSDVTVLQAIVLQLVSKSAGGDKRAMKMLMRYRQRNPETEELIITVIGGLLD